MRRPICKVDANQPAIVAALRDDGCTVQHLHIIGHGCPDIAVSKNGRQVFMEIKQLGESCTPDEIRWMAEWQGECHVVYTPEQAVKIMRGEL